MSESLWEHDIDADGTLIPPVIDAVRRAVSGGGVSDMHGEKVTWRGHGWTVVDVQNDGNHVHLTLTNPRSEPWSYRTTNDG